MPRFFNTSGPCDPVEHYMLPPMARLPDLQQLFDRKQYFVIHAPRQTGKTTAMRALAEQLRATEAVACWVSLERARAHSDTARPSRSGCRRSMMGRRTYQRRGVPRACRRR